MIYSNSGSKVCKTIDPFSITNNDVIGVKYYFLETQKSPISTFYISHIGKFRLEESSMLINQSHSHGFFWLFVPI